MKATDPSLAPEFASDASIAIAPGDSVDTLPAGARADAAPSKLTDLYELTKPRMNFLVLSTTAVGYYMASIDGFRWPLFLHTLAGTALTAAGASVLNQYVERDYDALMPRTQDRPLPSGRISMKEALVMGATLGLAGPLYLAFTVNLLTALLGAFTLLSYVLIYTPLKRRTTLNTVIGAVPGAIPPVMGWTAVTGALSPEALALFTILFLWQVPHFMAIAILYKKDYAAGGFKMLPVLDPELEITSRQIILYSLALVPATLMPVGLNMAGAGYFTLAVLTGLAFLTFGISVAATRTRSDARKLFFASIIYLPVLLIGMTLDKF